MAWQIKDWTGRFEISQTRKLKRLSRTVWPLRLDGRAYGRLVRDARGVAAYGVFAALVAVAARCEPRGALIRDDGRPMDLDDLEGTTRMPRKALAAALEGEREEVVA